MNALPRPGPLRRALVFVLALAALLAAGSVSSAAAQATGLTVTMINSPNLTLDSNQPCTGPQATFVAFRIANGTGTSRSGLQVTLSGLANGVVLSGGQAATQYVGTIPSGGSKTVYWLVQYPCTFGVGATLTATVTDTGAGSAAGSGTVTTGSMISAQAGGVLVSGILGAGAVVGQTIHLDVTYDFGGSDVGTTYDLQPVGNIGFDAGCFQMVGSVITTSNILAIPSGTANRQYFTSSVKQTGNGQQATIRYYFKYLCAGLTTTTRPYSNQLSGTQLKYSSNYTTFVGPTLPGATNPFVVTKRASPRALPTGGFVDYTVTVTNPSAFTAEVDSIVDILPGGMSFHSVLAGSGVTATNSGALPAAGATGRLVWRGIPGTSYALPAGGALTLLYRVSVGSTPGRYVNAATPASGLTALGTARDTVYVGSADVAVIKTGPASAVVGDTVRYIIAMNNAGSATALRLVLQDTLPVGVTFLSASRGATVSGRVVTWPAINLASGASRADTVLVTAPMTLTTLLNVAASTAGTFDPVANNNNGSDLLARVSTTLTGPVDVTPKGLSSPLPRLPGTAYPQVFTVTNASGSSGIFDLLARQLGTAAAPGVFLSLDSLTGPGITTRVRPDSVRLSLEARTSVEYTVWYTVPQGDTAVNVNYLRARAASDTTLRSEGWAEMRRVFPTLSLAKSVAPVGVLAPGTDLTYTLSFSNVGEYSAEGVKVEDAVPSQVFFKLGSTAQALPSGIAASVEYSSDGGTSWSYPPVSGGCGAPTGYDGCVNRVRWVLTGTLAAGASSAGTAEFVARIR